MGTTDTLYDMSELTAIGLSLVAEERLVTTPQRDHGRYRRPEYNESDHRPAARFLTASVTDNALNRLTARQIDNARALAFLAQLTHGTPVKVTNEIQLPCL